MTNKPVIFSAEEQLIRVDMQDRPIGFEAKSVCHDGEGLLHRAFSVFLFDAEDRVLIQQRSDKKRLWPLFWSNSCCSHPRKDEDIADAARRRVHEELGLVTELHFVYKFHYQANFEGQGAENELCSVFVGRCDAQELVTDEEEIADWRFVSVDELERAMQDDPERYTPWFKMEWAILQGRERETVLRLLQN